MTFPVKEAIAIEVSPPQDVVAVLKDNSYIYGFGRDGILHVTSYPTMLMVRGRSKRPEEFQHTVGIQFLAKSAVNDGEPPTITARYSPRIAELNSNVEMNIPDGAKRAMLIVSMEILGHLSTNGGGGFNTGKGRFIPRIYRVVLNVNEKMILEGMDSESGYRAYMAERFGLNKETAELFHLEVDDKYVDPETHQFTGNLAYISFNNMLRIVDDYPDAKTFRSR